MQKNTDHFFSPIEFSGIKMWNEGIFFSGIKYRVTISKYESTRSQPLFFPINYFFFSSFFSITSSIPILNKEDPKYFALNVDPIFILLVPPKILRVTGGGNVGVHNRTILTCSAEGNPLPKYQWLQKLPSQQVRFCVYKHQDAQLLVSIKLGFETWIWR